MKKALVILSVCLIIVLGCNNFCNGHGTCGSKDRCDCYPGWGGSDCSLRSCPYGEAFVDTILGDINHNGKTVSEYVKTEWNPIVGKEETLENTIATTGRIHRYAECSNAGLCNRVTGDCECFEGYEGSACQRRFCPSNNGEACSGHGQCISIKQYVNQRQQVQYLSWETEKFYKCVCDPNWDGIDCSERVCPKGLDPITQYEKPVTYKFFIESRDVSTVNADNELCVYNTVKKEYDCTKGLVTDVKSFLYYVEDFVIKYTSNGITYTSPVINGRPGTCPTGDIIKLEPTDSSQYQEEIKRAIRRIPPLSQVNVTVQCAELADEKMLKAITNSCPDDNTLDLTKEPKEDGTYCEVKPSKFQNGDSSSTKYYYFGYIVTIQMEYADRKAAENAIMTIEKNMKTLKYDSAAANAKYSPTTIPITSTTIADKPRTVADTCSGRGICDRTTGFCECFPGYYGYACDNQRKLPIAQ